MQLSDTQLLIAACYISAASTKKKKIRAPWRLITSLALNVWKTPPTKKGYE